MIRPPISQVGWASASSTVTRSSSVRPRNGPPEAVSISLSTVAGPSARSSWKIAECSESTGRILVPVASASAVTSSPPTTRLSLLASASSIPSLSATIVGPRPAVPTIALRTRSGSEATIRSRTPWSPANTRTPSSSERARSAASGSPIATIATAESRACAASRSQLPPAERPASSSDSEPATTSSACSPIDPVEPRIRTRLGTEGA